MNSVIYNDVMGVTDTPVIRDNVKELTSEIERLEPLDDERDQIESTDDQYKIPDSEIANGVDLIRDIIMDLFKIVAETPVMQENDRRNLIAEVERLERLSEKFYESVGIDDLNIVQDSDIGNIFNSIDADLANSDANFNGIASTAEQGCNQNVIVDQIQQSDMNYGDHYMLRFNDVPTSTESANYLSTLQPIIQPLVQPQIIKVEQRKALQAQRDPDILKILKELQSEDCRDEFIMANNSMPFCDSGLSNSERLPRNSVIDGDMLQESDAGNQSRIPILQQSQQKANVQRKRKYATRNNKKKDDKDIDEVIAKKFKEKSNVKRFECDICDERFCTTSEITKHIQVQHVKGHVGGVKKTNSIVTSGKSFKERELNQSDERHYACKICNTSFRRKCTLLHHLSIHARTKSGTFIKTEERGESTQNSHQKAIIPI